VGGEARGPIERRERDGSMTHLGRTHQGRSEVEDTLTMIPHGVEISIAGAGADEKDVTSPVVEIVKCTIRRLL